MPKCKSCQEQVDELHSVEVDGRKVRLCEDCAEEAQASQEIAEESEAVIQRMMGYKGRR